MGSSGGGTGASWTAASRPRKRGCPNRADQARRPRRGGSWSLARVLRGEHPGTRRPRRRGRWSSRPWRGCPCTGGRPGCSAIREYDRRGGGGAGGSNASEVTRSSRPCATTPHAPDQDGRCRRRYRRRWIVERTIGWLGTFCRLTVRYDRLLATYGGSTRQTRHVVCPACQTPLDGKPLSEDLLKATVMGSPDGSGGRSVESRHGADHISHATCFGVPAPPLS